MAQAPLWARAVKGFADAGTMFGNGLLLGQGPMIKGTLGYAGDNLAKATGLREGDYTPLANYIQSATTDVAKAREGSGSVGALAELGGNLASGVGLAKGIMAAPAALKSGTGAIPKLASKLLPKTPVVGEAGPMVPKVDIGTTMKWGGAGLTALGIGSAINAGAPELSDFTDATASSGVLPPKQGSAQVGAAAAEKSTRPQLTKGQQMKIDAMAGMSFDRLNKLAALKQVGATKGPTQKEIMLQRLDAMLQNQMLDAVEQGVDPRKAQADYLRNASALVAPSGVPFLSYPEE